MDMKYDKIIAITKEESSKKIKVAKKAIANMLNEMEKLSVAILAEQTGLSRGFYYKNPEVRAALNQAKHLQESEDYVFKTKSKDNNLSAVQEDFMKIRQQNRELLRQNQALELENSELKKKLKNLQKQLEHKEISLLKSL